MDFSTMHPAEQLAITMGRIYARGLTTTSGGNLSVMDGEGRVWVTPTSKDKAGLRAEDMACMLPDGSRANENRPSIEWRFHREVLLARPEFKAVVHAHSPAMMAWSFLRKIPPFEQFPLLMPHIGKVALAGYAKPGTKELSEYVYGAFKSGCNAAVLMNHGVVVGGSDLQDAYARFEELEYAAVTMLKAHALGWKGDTEIPEVSDYTRAEAYRDAMGTFDGSYSTPEECEARRLVVKLSHRTYSQKLCMAGTGSFAVRVDADSFVMTQPGVDRGDMTAADTVAIRGNAHEAGKTPDATVELFTTVLREHPEINMIMMANSQNSMAYAMAQRKQPFETIPEGYVVVHNLPICECGEWRTAPEAISKQIDKDTHVFVFKNDCFVSFGRGWFDTFDCAEVADYSAASMAMAGFAGDLVMLTDEELADL